jgi:hypothetical protein
VFFLINQLADGLFRLIASIGRTRVVANSIGTCSLLIVFVLGGFIIAKGERNDFSNHKKSTFAAYFANIV